ncbi:YwmB family TATA-box binding protein [Amphibacillus sp. MSJ-3]|uniref:YwmB family TATA-box binding protein n=1 Tax=Amphibacillus sp. MSJ-3 TaxID=2841505 RepID=UPI001C0E96D2|nr:YwmB family TATA-box binding protein [Amphibacillus sp. MSJ-3]MBU5594341.1 YwmB family TATA-box binding protein [Amphibacillus sp. MSJ-3]
MKRIIHSLLIFSLLETFIPIQEATPLEELLSFAEEHHYQVEYGELTIKESFQFEKLDDLDAEIIQAGFTKQETDFDYLLGNYQRQLGENLKEELTIIRTGDKREMTINYNLSGDVISLFQNREYYNLFKSFIGTIYTKEKYDYACISLSEHDMIVSGYFLERLEENLNYQEIDRLEEPDFIVISGYSAQFSQTIPIENEQMNMQISARKGRNGEFTFMIGTPILTTEY